MTELPEALLCDMDGTLIDSDGYWALAEERVLPRHGVRWREGLSLTSIGVPLGVWVAGLFDERGISADPHHACVEIEAEMVRIFAEKAVLWRPGAYELLSLATRLGIRSAVVTATHSSIVAAVRRQAPQGSLEVMVAGEMVSHGKPSPEGYIRAARELGVEPSQCLAFEDSEYGVRAALASGAVTVSVPFLVDVPSFDGVQVIASLASLDEPGLRRLYSTGRAHRVARPS